MIKPRGSPDKLPLSQFVSSLLQYHPHPKLTVEQAGKDDVYSDVELLALSDSAKEDENDYDQLLPLNPLKKYQKKQWTEQLKKLKELKKKGKESRIDHGHSEEDRGPATKPAVPMPDFYLPSCFDSDCPSYRYRMLEPTSQVLVRPLLESQGWDHDIGFDGVGLDSNLVIAVKLPGAFFVQFIKDKKEF
ncbi:hypothetical protein RCOM_0784930 [Ricinus communis]|uniref:Translocase of chloroplast 159/132 membrane anchor domain-containing protein n=1 Tax=Ricinus communis TaxID=3988 RepID=B9SB53_RICCO|nr:hypothetical protein RCOM_0784930 [Ricinus communis]